MLKLVFVARAEFEALSRSLMPNLIVLHYTNVSSQDHKMKSTLKILLFPISATMHTKMPTCTFLF